MTGTLRRWYEGKAYWLSLIYLLFTFTAAAQRYPFFNIGIEQGLVQSQVFALTQDHSGHLWAGTLGGLSCYDGHTFRSFTVRDGLPANKINVLHTDAKGYIWIGTDRGLSRYDGTRFQTFTFAAPDNPYGNSISKIAETSDGTIWCTALNALYKIRDGKTESQRVPNDCQSVTAIHGSGSDLWVGVFGASSLYRYKNGSWDSLALNGPDTLVRIVMDSHQRMITLGVKGVYQLQSDKSWKPLLARKSDRDPICRSFAEFRDGSYWLGCLTGGAFQIKGSDVKFFSKKNGLTDVPIRSLLSDREGNIWLAADGEGLYRFSGASFTAIDERMGLTAPMVSSIAQDRDGSMYFGTFDGGLYQYKEGNIRFIGFPTKDSKTNVGSLVLRGRTLWIGTANRGVWRMNLDNGTLTQFKKPVLSYGVQLLYDDSDRIWFGNQKGLFWVEGNSDSLHYQDVGNGMPEAMTRIGQDSLLVATSERLVLLEGNRILPFETKTAADSTSIVCVTYRDGIIWFGTGDNGLIGCPKNGGKIIHVTRENGMRSNFVYSIYAAPNGIVWAGTGFGICRIETKQAQPIVRFYGRSAGITGMESNRNAVYPLSDGSIWFGTVGGAFLYHPEQATAFVNPGSIQLQKLQLFGGPISDTEWYKGVSPLYGVPLSLRLPWKQNNLTFTFNAITLTGVEGISYRYKLDGLNAPWSGWSSNTSVAFSALPPGNYTLEVEASADGVHALPRTLRYSFEIITPFYKTNLFRLLVLAACILLGIAIQYIAAYRKRARRAMIEKLRREEQAKVRQRTAEDFHDEVGNKLTRINILTNVLRSKLGGAAPDATRIIDQIQDNAGQLYSGTRDILWSLQPSNDSLYQVLQRIGEFGLDLFGDTEVSFEIEGLDPSWKEYRLPMDASRNLIMIFKEALNNTLKYSMADKVKVDARQLNQHVRLTLSDDGQGFEPSQVSRGQGLVNMQTRAKRLDSELKVETEPGKGTVITLDLKIPAQKN
jgi:signal transduction histidine kinase/ligand-binding sensor domain-containing protein